MKIGDKIEIEIDHDFLEMVEQLKKFDRSRGLFTSDAGYFRVAAWQGLRLQLASVKLVEEGKALIR